MENKSGLRKGTQNSSGWSTVTAPRGIATRIAGLLGKESSWRRLKGAPPTTTTPTTRAPQETIPMQGATGVPKAEKYSDYSGSPIRRRYPVSPLVSPVRGPEPRVDGMPHAEEALKLPQGHAHQDIDEFPPKGFPPTLGHLGGIRGGARLPKTLSGVNFARELHKDEGTHELFDSFKPGIRRTAFGKKFVSKIVLPDRGPGTPADRSRRNTLTEAMADRMYRIFGAPVPRSQVYSLKTGKPVPHDHQWSPGEGATRVVEHLGDASHTIYDTPDELANKVIGAHLAQGASMSFHNEEEEKKYYRGSSPWNLQKKRHAIVDALFDSGHDDHAGNTMYDGKHYDIPWRIDNGDALQTDALGRNKSSWKLADHDRNILPNIFHLIHEGHLSPKEAFSQMQDAARVWSRQKGAIKKLYASQEDPQQFNIFEQRANTIARTLGICRTPQELADHVRNIANAHRSGSQGWDPLNYKYNERLSRKVSRTSGMMRRSFGLEMMNPLFKILGAQARDQGMERHPHVAGAFDSSERYPTGHFAPFGGHSEWDDDANHWDGHEGIFGKDRDLYLHVKPAPQHVTHVEGANQRLHLDDEENRPVHPYIQYLQVNPGAANPGPEHAQQVYEALHRQGYTGDTMDFFAPADSDGRRDKNGLNRRQRLYRPFVQGWKNFIQAKGYKQYPMAKSLSKSAAWQRKEGQNPKGGLNAKGRASAKREGHNLRPPVKSGDNPRRASFLARMGGSPGPEYDEKGKPTRLLLALRVWGASSKADAKKKAAAMSERLKNKKLAKGRGEDARQAHSFSGASEYSERECPTGQMTETRTNGSSHLGVFGEKRHILVESSRADLRGRDQTHINWVHIEPGTKVEPHHVTEIFGALHDAGYTKPMTWSALKDYDEHFSNRSSSRRDRFFRPLAAQWDKFVASKQAKMSKAEPNHNTSGPRSPLWQPEGGPKLTPRQIALQQQSAQKLAEIAAIPQGTPAARDASVPKRSRTPLMPKRSQGLLSTTSDGHVSVAEASRILGIPHAAVTKHIERGTFPARYDGTKRSIDISHPHFAAVRDGLRQGKTMKTILYDLEEKPVTEEEKKDSYGEMYGYPQGKRRYRSSRTRTGTSKQARLGEYQRISPVTGKPSKSTSLGRPPLADPYALFD